jgi:hypothetical protein
VYEAKRYEQPLGIIIFQVDDLSPNIGDEKKSILN